MTKPPNTKLRLGPLYAEDFDSPAPLPAPEPSPEPSLAEPPIAPLPAEPPIAPLPAEPSFTSGEMETARQRAAEAAVAEARAEWERSDAHARTLALAAIAAGLTAAGAEGRELAEAAADGTSRALLTMAAGLLPARCAAHGEAEVRHLLRHLLPTLQREPHVTVRVSPAVAGAVRADLELMDEELAARVSVLASGGMGPGDARVAWADGGLTRSTRTIHAAMVAALDGLGLVDTSVVKERAMEVADAG